MIYNRIEYNTLLYNRMICAIYSNLLISVVIYSEEHKVIVTNAISESYVYRMKHITFDNFHNTSLKVDKSQDYLSHVYSSYNHAQPCFGENGNGIANMVKIRHIKDHNFTFQSIIVFLKSLSVSSRHFFFCYEQKSRYL